MSRLPNTRIAFLLELARRLHQYGTSAPRLEMAIDLSARRLGLQADVWSSPTAIIISFSDLGQGDEGVAQRLPGWQVKPRAAAWRPFDDNPSGRICLPACRRHHSVVD